jgi:hypothetical protein
MVQLLQESLHVYMEGILVNPELLVFKRAMVEMMLRNEM